MGTSTKTVYYYDYDFQWAQVNAGKELEKTAFEQEKRYKKLLAEAREEPMRELKAQEQNRDRMTAELKGD